MAKHDKLLPEMFDPKPDVATTGLTNPVRVETGANVLCPAFIEMGDVIQADTRTGEQVERVKGQPQRAGECRVG